MRKRQAMVLVYKPELTHSMWLDAFVSDANGKSLTHDRLVEHLRDGVRRGEWVAWRVIDIQQEEMGIFHD